MSFCASRLEVIQYLLSIVAVREFLKEYRSYAMAQLDYSGAETARLKEFEIPS